MEGKPEENAPKHEGCGNEVEITLKGVSEREVFNALDALELLFEHSNVRWVKKFLDDHGIVVVE